MSPSDPEQTTPRALRVLLLANDGMSAGHVARAIAIGRALLRRAAARDLAARILFVTTSAADALLANQPFAFVRLPHPIAAREAGFPDLERRRVVRGALEGAISAFAPDVVVTDTFPSGPHGELAHLDLRRALRVLVRRAVPAERTNHETLTAGLSEVDLAIVADDPVVVDAPLSCDVVRVPPITMGEANDLASRDEARARLGLPSNGAAFLVTSGGGGDPEAMRTAMALAETLSRLAPAATIVRAAGPLEPRTSAIAPVTTIHEAPLQPWLRAFDGAFAAAGYNTAHELAGAGIPAALFACPRSFDDQAARAERFARKEVAVALDSFADDAVERALQWMANARPKPIATNGADHAADVLLDRVLKRAELER